MTTCRQQLAAARSLIQTKDEVIAEQQATIEGLKAQLADCQSKLPPPALKYGLAVVPRAGETWRAAVVRVERELSLAGGRTFKFAALRRYVHERRGENIRHPDVDWAVADGREVMVTFRTTAPWFGVVRGQADPWLRTQIASLLGWVGPPLILSYHHEMDGGKSVADYASLPSRAAAEYLDAYSYIREMFDGASVDARWAFNPTGWSSTRAAAFAPDPDLWDMAFGDVPYCWSPVLPSGSTGGTWTTPAWGMEQFLAWAKPLGKPMGLGEWGCQPDPSRPARKPEWIREAGATFAEVPNLLYAFYFDDGPDSIAPIPQNWRLDSSRESLVAFAEIAGGSA